MDSWEDLEDADEETIAATIGNKPTSNTVGAGVSLGGDKEGDGGDDVDEWLRTTAAKEPVKGMSLGEQQRVHEKLKESHPFFHTQPRVKILTRKPDEVEREERRRHEAHCARVQQGPEKTYEQRMAEYEARRAELGIQ
eukprot:TRINITY_DN1838_c0_g1_i3.p2 TRINITY_DN1838_c0_g1~~TRINITY_DN1838_c0_g1_i3.p2  ORF type:complete len:138 (-),score=51.01 TRINITY_DN1838_c0_g1_i3:285-698(-)